MQHVGAKFTRHANERYGGDGPIFRSRFFSRPILSEQYLVNAVRYVHRNPLAIRPSVALDTYRWSSHRTYLGLRASPTWLDPSRVLGWFDDQAQFHRFVSDAFEHTGTLGCDATALIGACEAAIDSFAHDEERGARGRLRTLLYLLLQRVEPSTARDLVTFLSPASPAALTQATRRAQRIFRHDVVLQAMLQTVLDLVTFTLCQTQRERQLTGSAELACSRCV